MRISSSPDLLVYTGAQQPLLVRNHAFKSKKAVKSKYPKTIKVVSGRVL